MLFADPVRGLLTAPWRRILTIRENIRCQLRGDLFNSFNHGSFGGLSTNISSSNFGRLTSATSRSMQLGVRLQFKSAAWLNITPRPSAANTTRWHLALPD